MQTAKLILCGGTLAVALMGSAVADAAHDQPIAQLETLLLHRQLDLSSVLTLEPKTGHVGPFRKGAEPLQVIHLWAIECAPCVAEMPVLRNIISGWSKDPEVRFLLISETLDQRKIFDYWRQSAAQVPKVSLLYQSIDEQIRDRLETGMQPITLLVDRSMVVRQAFVGPLTGRTAELAACMSRLLSVLREQK